MIDLYKITITIYKQEYSPDTTELNLKHKRLFEIPKDINKFSKLRSLNLSYCEITEIKEDTFKSLTNLQKLYLSYNEITEIKENTFKSLTNLQELCLGGNQIKEIKEDTFKSLTSLQELYLGGNQINVVKEDVFKSLTSLQILYLSNDQIKEIKEDTFKSLTNLQTLDLTGNQIKEIKEDTFKSLTSLQKLYLSRNEITEIKEDTFKSLTNLQTLDLSGNQIIEIKEDIFKLLTSLQTLNLSKNKITNLPLSILNCIRLQFVLIYENEITLDIRIQRFIDRMNNYNNHGIFKDSQNIHSSSIQKSVQESINNLMKDNFNVSKDEIVERLIELRPKCLTDLLCYLDDKDVHSILLLTFYEVFVKVFGRIINSEHKNELIKRLDEEMQESECKCFTGRITRLVNVLSGYFEDINITISNSERMSAIILTILDGREMNDEVKEICRKQLREADFEDEEIEKWINI